MDTPVPDNSGVANHSPSEMSDLTGDFIRTTGTPLLGSGKSISGDTKFLDMDAPVLDASGVAHQLPSDMPDLAGDINRTTVTPLLGSSELNSGDNKLSTRRPHQ